MYETDQTSSLVAVHPYIGLFVLRLVQFIKLFAMRLVILDKAADVAEWSARYVMKRINEFRPNANKYFVLGLPTGGFC